MKREIKEIPEAPTVVGSVGKAWDFDLSTLTDRKALLHAWRIRAPWAHPVWYDYSLSLIHLRDLPGMGPAKLNLPGATHEFHLYALDLDNQVDLSYPPKCLLPANFGAQFIAEDDEMAERRMEETIKEVCDGYLSPDTDYLSHWVERFGSNLIK